MKKHERFEWDSAKAATNAAKHGVTFDDAAVVLADAFYEMFHVEEFDAEHSDELEDRWITIGSHPFDRSIILTTVWTETFDEAGSVTRIVTARHASRGERTQYDQEIRHR